MNYKELILGVELKKDTPESIIEILKYLIDDTTKKPKDFPKYLDEFEYIFQGGSFYFAVGTPVCEMRFDETDKHWHISTRSNFRHDIYVEPFLEWLRPYICSGSGEKDIYAIVIEELGEPALKIYHLKD